MKNLIKAEIWKLGKRKVFYFILLFNCISFLYSLGMYFEWGWIEVTGEFDLIDYTFGMWQLLFLIGIPLIVFMYVGASLIGTERTEGQIILETTRVANRKKIIYSKFITMLIVILFYFISNITISIICYVFIVKCTPHATSDLIVMSNDNLHLIISSLGVLFYMIFSTFIAMYVSIKRSALSSTIIGLVIYLILSLAVRVPNLQYWIPGYFALTIEFNLERYLGVATYQIIINVAIAIIATIAATKQFKKIDL